ncbi:nucleolar protein dao-5 isoform X2 [Bradysia coprophila]|uniref:nucleolar protein dao-5 isoform X2 n=1 Tax=Bradysia coprophila TaxID=38358 RepID=UPI00187DAE33|nr:nucleolar protein dao-5 isoform X2 [Bradysia coprophila]XP_037030175.1 nucleolar protein dao-5 isoform X2 [Bradysia coprophila]XP_037030177.1 nucleolar protein dao-5 isoform X2 [Bradysia coprophila]
MQKQVAHIVGSGGNGGSVLKREPCQKCNLPVFLAERLVLGQKLFHRTCLKCARCQSQLTPGSFYETEVDGEFCCETCPDEEKEFALKERLKGDVTVDDDGNKSFTEKLAIFQTDGKGLLQKSLSDEEKSKSLKRLTEFYSNQDQTYKTNKALSSFINNQVDTDPSVTSTSSIKSDDSSSSSDDESDNEDPPDLPTTKPPTPPCIPDNVSDQTTSLDTSQLNNSKVEIDKDDPQPLKKESPSPNRSSSTINILSENIPLHDEMPADAFHELSNVTKEESKHENQVHADADCAPQIRNKNASGPAVSSMVRSRLSQFETKIGADQQIASKSASKKLDVSEIGDSPNVSHIPADEFEVPAADQIKLISSDVISDIRKYEDDDTKRDEIFERNVKSETDDKCENEVPSNGELGDSIDVDLRKQNEIVETFECEKSENKTNEDELVRRENEIQLDESVDGAPTESNPPDVEFVEIVVPVPRKRNSKNPKDEEETAKPIPVKRGAKAKKASNQTAESNATFEDQPSQKDVNSYPLDLNPFGSDDDDDEENTNTTEVKKIVDKKPEVISSNPFDSSDDEVELEKDSPKKRNVTKDLSKSRMSLNPFGSDTEDDEEEMMDKQKRTPVPTPRKVVTSSLNSTPEPTPRLSRAPYNTNTTCNIYGSEASLSSTNTNIYRTSDLLVKNNYLHGSTNSLASSSGSAHRRKKCRAPLPPAMLAKSSNELSVSKENSPTHSTRTSPSPRKKRPAPAPPSSTPKYALQSIPSIVAGSLSDLTTDETIYVTAVDTTVVDGDTFTPKDCSTDTTTEESLTNDNITTMRLIPLEASLLEDSQKNSADHRSVDESDSVVFRRRIVPYTSDSATDDSANYNDKSMNVTDDLVEHNARQWQKMKENKETQNKNRQSQISLSSPEPDHIYSNKSSYGKWKRRKGPAPALPVPPRKILQMVPLQEIRHELEVIEVQQLGLEKQGVMLEKMIRERCEGTDPQFNEFGEPQLPPDTPNTKEVEDLILQLFELVNEKNELFRRQAELMYLRRQHRLEQEQADIEYEIRVLMAQPERNKTDCDKAREEALITRLVEVVQLRNEVIECLEMDRLREAEEDQSIKQRLELHTAKRDVELSKQTPTKLSKKEKKKQKESKKLFKQKKMDADKDADDTEIQTEKAKKKKRKFLF